jgi:hypothetical protein
MLPHLRPNLEMPHRALKHIQAVQHLIDVISRQRAARLL